MNHTHKQWSINPFPRSLFPTLDLAQTKLGAQSAGRGGRNWWPMVDPRGRVMMWEPVTMGGWRIMMVRINNYGLMMVVNNA